MNRAALTLALFLVAPFPAPASELDWLPSRVRAQLAKIPESTSKKSRADLYLCHPFCELLGEFHSRTDFHPRAGKGALAELSEAKKAENTGFLRVILGPLEIARPESLAEDHAPEPVTPYPESTPPTLPVVSAGNTAQNSAPKSEAARPAAESTPGGVQTAQIQDQSPPLLLGGHIDAFLGGNSLSTDSNTDVTSDFQAHPVVGAGLDFDAPGLTPLWRGNLGATFDLSYWDALSPKSKNSAGQNWSSETERALIGAIWQKAGFPLRLGLLIEGRNETDTASPDTAIAFSSTYFWASVGVHLQYRKTTFQILHSLLGLVQDADQYRGTDVSSARTLFDLTSCKELGSLAGGEFDICANGQLNLVTVTATGTPAQPVFTSDPSYHYAGWQGGLQFKIGGISL